MPRPRLTTPVLKVMAALLADRSAERYGLQLMQDTGLPSGTLYPILVRLERAGWVESRWEGADPVAEGRPNRRYYRLTAEGAVAARDEVVRASELGPTSSATTVRVKDGTTVVTDGPYAETKEALTGFYLLECADLDEALAIANDSDFGLQAGVFTNDLSHAMRAWDELEQGGVIVNDVPSFRVDNMPYGGAKSSGIGLEGVRYAIEDMSEQRLLVIRDPTEAT